MNFVSDTFIIFLAAIWCVFAFFPARYRVPWLTAASYIFYASWSVPFIAVILFTTSVDYCASKIIFQSGSSQRRKAALLCALMSNLLVLGFFKYFNLFLSTNNCLLAMAGLHNPLPPQMDILLPLGISFYTFEAISYVIDVYRGMPPAESWWKYNFYIMYFPHLISGPIIRFGELWKQYEHPIELPSWQRFRTGITLVLLGYVFKIVIANTASLLSDPLFAAPEKSSVLQTYVGSLAFTTQLYFDFLGYTHIARGVSLFFNIELPLNFNHPYSALNISNFWERWHISLSRWLRDYIYLPLGGSKHGVKRAMLNVLLVMAVCGIWHGAKWTHLSWGIFLGICLIGRYVYKHFRKLLLGESDRSVISHPLYSLASIALTFTCFSVGTILFRSPNISSAFTVYNHLLRFSSLSKELGKAISTGELGLIVSGALLLICCFAGPFLVRLYVRLLFPLPIFVKVQFAVAATALCWIMCADSMQPFIYFQF